MEEYIQYKEKQSKREALSSLLATILIGILTLILIFGVSSCTLPEEKPLRRIGENWAIPIKPFYIVDKFENGKDNAIYWAVASNQVRFRFHDTMERYQVGDSIK